MAENLLSDARVRAATVERDGPYLPDGGGLRIRLLAPSRKHPRGAKLAEYHFKVRDPDTGAWKNGALHLGTIGDPFLDDASGTTRPFTLADARRGRNVAREQLAQGHDPRLAQRVARETAAQQLRARVAEIEQRQTVRSAYTRWMRLYVEHHRKDGGRQVRSLFETHLLPVFGELPLAELTKEHIVGALHKVLEQGKRRTVNMLVQVTRQFVLWCVDAELLQKDPTHRLSAKNMGGRLKPRQRALTGLEIVELRDALPAARLPARVEHSLWLLLATGVRVGELAAARRVDIELDATGKRGTWRLPETKNGRPHLVHLSAFAVQHVQALLALAGRSKFLLPARLPKARASEDRAAAATDKPMGHEVIGKAVRDRQRDQPLKGRAPASGALVLSGGAWTPHDLRRTMATRMREDVRVSFDVVERCLNHTPPGLLATYQTGELLEERRAAFEDWGAELQRLMALKLDNVVALPQRGAA